MPHRTRRRGSVSLVEDWAAGVQIVVILSTAATSGAAILFIMSKQTYCIVT